MYSTTYYVVRASRLPRIQLSFRIRNVFDVSPPSSIADAFLKRHRPDMHSNKYCIAMVYLHGFVVFASTTYIIDTIMGAQGIACGPSVLY